MVTPISEIHLKAVETMNIEKRAGLIFGKIWGPEQKLCKVISPLTLIVRL